jgi:L-threonylcarbamoyladenylate synthase
VAANEQAVEKVFAAKHRDRSKQCIVLISDAQMVKEYGDTIASVSAESTCPTSVIVPATTQPEWLLRGGDTIAYRIVQDPFLKQVVETVGPVIAPSANPEGLAPARTITQARTYFGDTVDCYIDGGEVPATVQASEIVYIRADGSREIVRP